MFLCYNKTRIFCRNSADRMLDSKGQIFWLRRRRMGKRVVRKENKSKIARVRNEGRWHSRGSDWATPQDLYDKLDAEFHFTLDVCASDWNAKHINYFNEET